MTQCSRGLSGRQVLKVAVIGVSGFGAVHCADLLRQEERGRIELVGAAVRNQTKDAEVCRRLRERGCAIYADYREMLAELMGELDLCAIPTAIHAHAEMTVTALAAGANVLVEKPVAATLGETARMEAASREAERFVAVGFQTMYGPEAMLMKTVILEGDIGTIEAIKSFGLWPRLDRYYNQSNWIGRLRVGERWVLDSPFNNAMAHQLNMICFLAGSELHRTAELGSITAELYRAHNIESCDTVALCAETQSGVPLFFFATHASAESRDPEIVVRGSKGEIHWTFPKLRITRNGASEEHECQTGTTLRDSMFDAVLNRVSDTGRFICGLDIACAHTLAVNGAHLSGNIASFPDSLISRFEDDGSVKTVVSGLDDAIAQAFAEERLFSELGMHWARATRCVDLSDVERIAAQYP
jgi:predicted dehydrogenase